MATLVFKVSGEVMAKFCQNPDLCRKVKSAQISLMMPVASTQIFGFISTWPPWWFHVHHLRRASTSLEARLKNPSLTCFMMKQATGCPMHVLTSFSSTHWFWGANWQISSHLVLRPKPRNRCSDFVGQITKPHLPFLRMKPGNPSEWFWGQTTRTVATGFEAKPRETVDLGFEVEPRDSHFSSPCARCKSHTASPDLSIVRPPSTRPVRDHPRSSAPGLLLLPWSSSLPTMSHLSPTHHETSKCDSLHKHIGVKQLKYLGFEFKPRQVNDSSQSNLGTDHLVSQKEYENNIN
jgi:hypothetical protein